MSKIEEIKVSSKGQLVIPKQIREELGMKSGSKVIVTRQGQAIMLVPKPSDSIGALMKLGKELNLGDTREEMKKHRRME